jgi:hypothetical protein
MHAIWRCTVQGAFNATVLSGHARKTLLKFVNLATLLVKWFGWLQHVCLGLAAAAELWGSKQPIGSNFLARPVVLYGSPAWLIMSSSTTSTTAAAEQGGLIILSIYIEVNFFCNEICIVIWRGWALYCYMGEHILTQCNVSHPYLQQA